MSGKRKSTAVARESSAEAVLFCFRDGLIISARQRRIPCVRHTRLQNECIICIAPAGVFHSGCTVSNPPFVNIPGMGSEGKGVLPFEHPCVKGRDAEQPVLLMDPR